MVQYGAHRDCLRCPVARTRQKIGVRSSDDMPVLRDGSRRSSVSRSRLQGYGRSLLGWLRARHRASVFAQRRIDGLGLTGEHQSMAAFSTLTILWGIGWLIYMDSNVVEVHYLRQSFCVWIGLCGSVSDFEYWHHWNGFGQLTTTGRTGGGGGVMDLYQQLLELAKAYPNYGATIVGVIGMFFTAMFGYLLKRPMTRQAIRNDEFTTTIKGLRELVDSQRETISHFEEIQRAHERDRDHWYRTREQLNAQIEDLQSRLRPWPDTPTDGAVILVVEDDNRSARVVCRIIERMQLEGFVVTRGYDALRHLRSGQFKLMVLDFGLPDINGIDVAILTRRAGFDIPIIGLTGVAGDLPLDTPRMVEARFTAILPKTSRADEIMDAIRKVLPPEINSTGDCC